MIANLHGPGLGVNQLKACTPLALICKFTSADVQCKSKLFHFCTIWSLTRSYAKTTLVVDRQGAAQQLFISDLRSRGCCCLWQRRGNVIRASLTWPSIQRSHGPTQQPDLAAAITDGEVTVRRGFDRPLRCPYGRKRKSNRFVRTTHPRVLISLRAATLQRNKRKTILDIVLDGRARRRGAIFTTDFILFVLFHYRQTITIKYYLSRSLPVEPMLFVRQARDSRCYTLMTPTDASRCCEFEATTVKGVLTIHKLTNRCWRQKWCWSNSKSKIYSLSGQFDEMHTSSSFTQKVKQSTEL